MLFSAANLFFVAYKRYHSGGFGDGEGPWQAYAAAASMVMLVMPYSLVVMKDLNERLLAAGRRLGKRSEIGVAEDEGVKKLVDGWATRNFFRALLPLVGGLVGTWAALG
jgi:hypothetical protein